MLVGVEARGKKRRVNYSCLKTQRNNATTATRHVKMIKTDCSTVLFRGTEDDCIPRALFPTLSRDVRQKTIASLSRALDRVARRRGRPSAVFDIKSAKSTGRRTVKTRRGERARENDDVHKTPGRDARSG